MRRPASILLVVCALWAPTVRAAGGLEPVAPTPPPNALVAGPSIALRLTAPCDVDPTTLSVTIDGLTQPAGDLLPFSACVAGRVTSQTALFPVVPPEGIILTAPAHLDAGATVELTGSGDGDGLAWSFDGGAPPATGETVHATFAAAGTFTVQLRATRTVLLDVGVRAGRTPLRLMRPFVVGDPTPALRDVTVTIAPDVDFVNFETNHVHPLALSPDGARLYALDTPGARVTVFAVGDDGSLTHVRSIPVGLEPVSLALHPDRPELWVVNHLSDSVSIVDLDAGVVTRTLDVGDEPTDVAFAAGRAFVSIQGEDRIVVLDADTRDHVAALDVFGDDPQALAVSDDGQRVYAVVLRSGNRTTIMSPSGFGVPTPLPPDPPRAPDLPPFAPFAGTIVQFDPATGAWLDGSGVDRGFLCCGLPIQLPDLDLFVIDAATAAVTGSVAGIGTTLADVIVRPGTSQVWVPNTDARNVIRFVPVLDGHLVDTRVSIVDPSAATVVPVDLNPHIDRAVTPGPPAEVARSLSQPGAGAFTADGSTLYLAAFGSGMVALLDPSGSVTDRIAVGAGPSGVALDEARGRLFVLNRLDATVSIVDTATRASVDVVGIAGPGGFDPTPEVVRRGRRFLYDAAATSGHGDVACASCHLSGHTDGLVWDLGDPQGTFVPYADAPWVTFFLAPSTQGFDPMKGPLATQSLRGLEGGAPFHWRGDRPDLLSFNVNFTELQRTAAPLPASDMADFATFLATIRVPPNPLRNLDDTLPASLVVPRAGGGVTTGDPGRGGAVFRSVGAIGNLITCDACHTLPTGSNNKVVNEFGSQEIETPPLRQIRDKLDFGLGGPQKRGFGVEHDGGRPLPDFLASNRFTLSPQDERDVLAFVLTLPGDVVPAVGRQMTIDAETGDVVATLEVLAGQAAVGRCDLVAHGRVDGVDVGFVFDAATGRWLPDREGGVGITTAALLASVGEGNVVTVTGVPPGSGRRLGVDRDRDTWLDASEAALGFDAADPRSNPWGTLSAPMSCSAMLETADVRLRDLTADYGRQQVTVRATLTLPPEAALTDGLRLLVEDLGAGGTLLDWTVPGADTGSGCDPRADGWRISGDGRVAVYRNRSGVLPARCTTDANGLDRVRLRRSPRGDIEVTVSARRVKSPTPVGPLQVTVAAGTDARAVVRGECGAYGFGVDKCRFDAGHRRLRCRSRR